jgi:YVTN family beta-propeller protein
MTTVTVGAHPCSMALSRDGLLYVTDANSDAVSVVDTHSLRQIRKLSVRPTPTAPLSSSPEGLDLSPDGRFLYVANAGDNDVLVFARSGLSSPERLLGRIPVGWYPTAMAAGRDGQHLYVINAKGRGAGPNSSGIYPDPTRQGGPFYDGYNNAAYTRDVQRMMVGTLSTIPVPDAAALAAYTARVAQDNRLLDPALLERSPHNPIPLPGGVSLITHVIYIIRENRSYDQVLGDEPIGNGDPALTLFGRHLTPNTHALAERYGLLDNYYSDAETSSDGHNWTLSANASDYNQKTWPQFNRNFQDFEGGTPANSSAGGYLWDAAAAAGITYRDYGEWYAFDANSDVRRGKAIDPSQAANCPGPVARSYDRSDLFGTPGITGIPAGKVWCMPALNIHPDSSPNLIGHYDPRYRLFDTRFNDLDRVAEWQREFTHFVQSGTLPRLEIIRLPNDHTTGTIVGARTPQAMVAQNDLALGRIVDAVSHSPYWGTTAIFVTEDDAINGPDHVEAHRTVGLVISPFTARSQPRVDHTQYDMASMLRTTELILGLRPMSQFDAGAMPMWRLFSDTPDPTPYTARLETTNLTTVNTPRSFGASLSAKLDFAHADRAPAGLVNWLLWHAVKGRNAPDPVTHYTWGAEDGH